MSPKKWIRSFFCLALAALALLCAAAWAVDPYLQFRVRDNTYLLNARFVDAGLIANYDYDTLLAGSSMTQNFDMELFRAELDCKPLHVSLGGLNALEMSQLVQAAYRAGKAETLYLCVDLSYFTDEPSGSQFPAHLFRSDILSRLRYLLSYEVWFRYIPADLALMAADRLDIALPPKYIRSRSIDLLENWSLDEPTGKDVFLRNAWLAPVPETPPDREALLRGMLGRADAFLAGFDFSRCRHVFFFPPYSGLFWYNAYLSQDYENYLRAKEYFVCRAEALGAEVYDFQGAPFTSDMGVYRDSMHYGAEINDWMTRCFASGDYRAAPERFWKMQVPIAENMRRFLSRFLEAYPPEAH